MRPIQRESNMRRFEGHHFTSPIAPYFLVGKTVDSYRRSSRNSGISHRKGGRFPLRKRGAKGIQNGNHDLVHVCFSLRILCIVTWFPATVNPSPPGTPGNPFSRRAASSHSFFQRNFFQRKTKGQQLKGKIVS